jgi:hypothetical protein
MKPGEKVRLTLRALPGPSPPINRLRSALKTLLRAYGFRCLCAEWLPEKPMSGPNPKPEEFISNRAWCQICGEEILFNGRFWIHEVAHPDGHNPKPWCYRPQAKEKIEDVNLRIKAEALDAETFSLKGKAGCDADLRILADATAPDGKKKLPTFTMTAYTGVPMSPSGWYRPEQICVDLAGMAIGSQTLPIDKDHGTLVGHTTAIDKTPGGQRLKCKGVLSGYDPTDTTDSAKAARDIVRMGSNGLPFQASIDCTVSQIQMIEAGDECKVNGQVFKGPLYVARASVLKGVAILAGGADGNTCTKIAAKADHGAPTMDPEFVTYLKANDYTDEGIKALTEKQRAPLEAAFKVYRTPPPPIAQPVNPPAANPPAANPANPIKAEKTPEQLDQERLITRRRNEALEDERIAAIRKVCASKPEYKDLETIIDDPDKPGTNKKVQILTHAITAGWTARQTELECVREARPSNVHGFSHSHESDCTKEALTCAMLLRSNVKSIANGPQQDILCHPVFHTEMALCTTTHENKATGQTEQREMIPAFLRQNINTEQRQKAMESAWRYRDMGVVDLCAEALRIDGRNVPHGREARVQAAFSSGALNNIFTTNINVILLATYAEVQDYTQGWTSTVDVNDFKTNERPRMVKGGPLAKLPRGGTADHTSRSDTMESYKIQRYSRQFQYDEQDAIDDHWNAFADIPVEMGNAAGRMRPSLITAILLANPTLSQTSRAIFNSTDGNLLAANLLTLANFQTACLTMRKFQENGVNLNLMPTHVVVPADLDFALDQILHSSLIVAAGATNPNVQYGNLNPVLKVKAQPLPTPYLSNGVTDPDSGTVYAGSTTTWYLVSNNANTLEVGYLRGTGRAPQMRSWMLQWGQFGIGYDVRLDIGAKALDWRGMVQSTS